MEKEDSVIILVDVEIKFELQKMGWRQKSSVDSWLQLL